jgi:subtilisin family serine protease
MEYRKLSAGLISALNAMHTDGRAGLSSMTRRLGLVTVTEPARPARAVVFLRLSPEAAADEAIAGRLRAAGVELNEASGTVRTGLVSLESVADLSAIDGVEKVSAARRMRPVMDVAPGKAGVPAFVRRTSLDGEGVVVGVVDTGIDPRHPAFTGRILRIWDQTLRGTGVPEGGYGMELTGAQMIQSRDTHGHGTHVSGIAAGQEARYPGVAPKADIVMVKTDLLDAHIADGVRYCLRVARELDRPVVVNLSLGGHADAHDGTDPLSQVIDAESGAGRIVVCAAGNEGDDAIHAQTKVRSGGTRSLPWSGTGEVELNLWYGAADALDVAVAGPSGAVTPWQGVRAQGNPFARYDLPDGTVEITTPGADPANGDHHVLVHVTPNAGGGPAHNPNRTWRLRLRGRTVRNGLVDAWLLSEHTAPASFTGSYVSDSMKVGSPGAATTALTAAAYTTKVSWVDVDGQQRHIAFDADTIASFSSEGPRRDGHQKPDVALPGAMIASALSADADMQRAFVLDQQHVLLAGTSMASPFLAGLVALMLQEDPTLDPEKARTALRAAAAVPGAAAGGFDPKWGYGLVDADKL